MVNQFILLCTLKYFIDFIKILFPVYSQSVPNAVSGLASTTLINPSRYSSMFPDGLVAFHAFLGSDFHWSKTIRYFFSSPSRSVGEITTICWTAQPVLMPPPMVFPFQRAHHNGGFISQHRQQLIHHPTNDLILNSTGEGSCLSHRWSYETNSHYHIRH